jgi:hypothetical protein
MNPECLLHVYKSLPLEPFLNQINLVHALILLLEDPFYYDPTMYA